MVSAKKFKLYPPTKKIIEVETEVWIDDDNEKYDIGPISATSQIDEEDHILNLMENNESSSCCERNKSFQGQCNIQYLSSCQFALHSMEKFCNCLIENFLGKH